MRQDDDDHDGCDNPDCPIHGDNPIDLEGIMGKGFKVFSGKGGPSLAAILGKLFSGGEDAKQREKVREKFNSVLTTVIRMQTFDDALENDAIQQGLMEALCELLASAMATYTFDYLTAEPYNLQGDETTKRTMKLAADHWQSMLTMVVRQATGTTMLGRVAENHAREVIAKRDEAKDQAEQN